MAETSAPSRPHATLGVVIATAFGIGYLRPGPGTWASVATGVCAWPVCRFADQACITLSLVSMALASLVAGLLSARSAIGHFGRSDPSQVVIDEVLGTAIAIGCIPANILHRDAILAVLVAVVAFRVFDIAKPWPVSWFERLPGGWGIMADDLVAGLFAGAFSAAVLH